MFLVIVKVNEHHVRVEFALDTIMLESHGENKTRECIQIAFCANLVSKYNREVQL